MALGLFTRIFGASERRSTWITNPADWNDLILFGPTLAGVNVSALTAMAVPAVRSAVESISEAAGYLPCYLYQKGADDSRKRAEDHPAFSLLTKAANPWTTATSFIEQLVRDALLYGNSYTLINRAGGEVRELLRLPSDRVTVELDANTSEPRYKLSQPSGARILPYTDVLHVKAPSLDGVSGTSPIQHCREAIALLIVLQQHANKLFGKGARPSGLLKFPQKLGTEVAQRIKTSWTATQTGENAGGTAVLEEGGEFQPLSFNSVDSQFLEIWQLAILEVARVFRVSPVLLQDYTRQTWANAETGGQQFLTYTLGRWLEAIEQELNLKLLSVDEHQTHYFEFLVDALLQADFEKRAAAYGQYRSMGAMTANEVRKGLNLPPKPDGDSLQNPYTTTVTTQHAPSSSKPKPNSEGANDGQ